MAQINRFFNPQVAQPAQYNPLSFEQMMATPMYMRQQHDIYEQNAIQNAIMQADTMDQDVANQAYAPIKQEFESIVADLAKNGYNPQINSKFSQYSLHKAEIENKYLKPLEVKKQTYLAKVADIKEFYKDGKHGGPQAMEAALRQLQAEQAYIDPITGELGGLGMSTPYYAKVLSTEEEGKIRTQMMDALKKSDLGALGVPEEVYTKGFDSVVRFATYSGVEGERIRNYLNTMGLQDLYESSKMREYINGTDLVDIEQIKVAVQEGASEKIAEIDQKINELSTSKKEEDLKLINEYEELKNTLTEEANKINEFSSTEDLINYKAEQSVNNFIEGSVLSQAYADPSYHYTTLTDDLGLHLAKLKEESKADILPFDVNTPARFESEFTDFIDKNGDILYDKDGNISDIEPTVLGEIWNNLSYLGYDVIGQVSGSKVDFIREGIEKEVDKNYPDMSFEELPKKVQDQIEEKVKREYEKGLETKAGLNVKQQLEDLKTKVSNIRMALPNTDKLSDKEIVGALTAREKLLDVEQKKAFDLVNQKGQSLLGAANTSLLGRSTNGTYTNVPHLGNLSFDLGDGKTITYNKAMESLGYDFDTSEAYGDFVNASKPVITGIIPQQGKFTMEIFNSDGQPTTVFVEPKSRAVKAATRLSSHLYNFFKSGKLIGEPIQGRSSREILIPVNNFGDLVGGKARMGYIAVNAEEVEGRTINNILLEQLLSAKKGIYLPQDEVNEISMETVMSLAPNLIQ